LFTPFQIEERNNFLQFSVWRRYYMDCRIRTLTESQTSFVHVEVKP